MSGYQINFEKSKEMADKLIAKAKKATTFRELNVVFRELENKAKMFQVDRDRAHAYLLQRRAEFAETRGKRKVPA